MPRISAPTLAEHRQRQLEALLDASRQLLVADGAAAVTFSAVAARTGLARNSLYEYFRSRDDLIAATCEAVFPGVRDQVAEAVRAATDLAGRVEAFVRVQLELTTHGEFRYGVMIDFAGLEPEARARVVDLHRSLLEPLVEVLRDAGHPEPEETAAFVQGVVAVGVRKAHEGADIEALVGSVATFALEGVHGGLRAVTG